MSDQGSASSYDEIPYESHPWYPTHPDCQATVARLFGMHPPAVDRCRVLELGCATGGNLIPMGLMLPDSQFVGIDLSAAQVAEGRQVVETLGLRNVDLRAVSITDVDASFGQFDYVICHGVFSWVPPAVQDRILAICKERLTPNGVACVSYNTYPGWHQRQIMREFLGFHVRPYSEPRVRLQQARALLGLISRLKPEPGDTHGQILVNEAALLAKERDAYLFHEHLEDENRPRYFEDFVRQAQAYGLQYLAEAWLDAAHLRLPPEVLNPLLEGCPDRLHLEQYLDFLCNRTFRVSLLCDERHRLHLGPVLDLEEEWHVTGGAGRVASASGDGRSGVESFATVDGHKLTTDDPCVKTLLPILQDAWPAALPLAELVRRVQEQMGASGEVEEAEQKERLAGALIQCYRHHVIALHRQVPRFATRVSEKPVASPLARLQARRSKLVANCWHRPVTLEDLARLLLPHVDGSRDRQALLDLLVQYAQNGTLNLQEAGQPIIDAERIRTLLAPALDECLRGLAASALLME